ncbi:L-amino acid N-acyltransferase YncA [Pedobacter cryoconitis]|uniref:L-amino acid N-acyltransferase YncA n=1 Tax=Pedobacter cryoconitis TaxID=188932 RepID=A0A7W9E130_9SPHI|nr:GNAT family N-acetyltransferase [Pedobacter cryoconitis]MBB5637240.1 L-amino acid N-acyltransferase YncA [Pedobacter cryoconitis]
MNNFIIRTIKENELDDLIRLIEEHTAYEKAAYDSTGKKERLHVQLFQSKSQLKCWVVEIDGKLKGFCTYTIDYSTWDAANFLYMDCLYLCEDTRGMGIGSEIIRKLKEIAQENDCVNLQWQTPVFNQPAIDFYKKNGAASKDKVRFTLTIKA